MTRLVIRHITWMHLCVALACAPQPDAIEAIAEGYVRVSLQMAQHDPTLVEDWRGSEAWRPGPRVPVAEVRARIDGLRQRLEGLTPTPALANRRSYLLGQLRALQFAARRLTGEPLGIDDQAKAEFGIELGTADPARMAEVRAAIDRVLPGPGSTVERFSALKARTLVPEGRRLAVMEAALGACRRASAGAFTLPGGERTSVTFERGLGWDGYAHPLVDRHTVIAVNADGPMDVSRALRLACHEGYPGHHVQQLLIHESPWRSELELSPGFGPHLLFAEGAAEAGADLAFAPGERERLYREELLPAAGLPLGDAPALAVIDDLIAGLQPIVTDVARDYLDGTLAKAQAESRLRDEALVLTPEATLAMIERRRARALVYGEGRRAVYARMGSRSPKELAALFSATFALP